MIIWYALFCKCSVIRVNISFPNTDPLFIFIPHSKLNFCIIFNFLHSFRGMYVKNVLLILFIRSLTKCVIVIKYSSVQEKKEKEKFYQFINIDAPNKWEFLMMQYQVDKKLFTVTKWRCNIVMVTKQFGTLSQLTKVAKHCHL